jgi:hypothetical protein
MKKPAQITGRTIDEFPCPDCKRRVHVMRTADGDCILHDLPECEGIKKGDYEDRIRKLAQEGRLGGYTS